MRIIEKTLYKFKELSEEVQEEVIEQYYENEDYPFLTDDIESELEYADKDKIFEDVKLWYSLSYCQGDGLSFSSTVNVDNLLKMFEREYCKEPLTQYIKNALKAILYSVSTSQNTGHYCFCSKSDVEFEIEPYTEELKLNRLNKLIDEIENALQNYYLETCKQLEKYGYEVLEYRMNKEEFADYAQDNEYYEDGDLY